MREIKYVGFYDTPENSDENRNYVPSCATKMEYIISAENMLQKLCSGKNSIFLDPMTASRRRQKTAGKQNPSFLTVSQNIIVSGKNTPIKMSVGQQLILFRYS